MKVEAMKQIAAVTKDFKVAGNTHINIVIKLNQAQII